MSKIDPNAFTTNKTLGEAVDTILKGMEGMFTEERKFNIQTFATKDELKTEISWVRDDIKGLTAELSQTVSKKEFNKVKSKVDKYLTE